MVPFLHRIFAASIPFILLSACTAVSPPTVLPTPIAWKNRELALNRIQSWQIAGKMSIQTNKAAGSTNVSWVQNHDQYTISLYGPLGTGNLTLTGQPGLVTLNTPNGKPATAATPEQLLAQQWGWDLPVSHLNYWIRGLPVPSIPYHSRFDSYHRLSVLRQQGWEVQFLSYTNTDAIDLPVKIVISSPMLQSKIVIHQWKIIY